MNFEDAIAAQFAPPRDPVVMDGKIHRFATNPRKPYSKDGWYIGYDDDTGRAGVFGSWRDGSKHAWSNGTGRKLTADEFKKIDEAKEASYKLAQEQAAAAAKLAKEIYAKASSTGVSQYLARKKIGVPDGVRFVENVSSKSLGFDKDWPIKAAIVIPMRDAAGDIKSLQFITDSVERNKLFLKNGRASGLFHVIGGDIAGASRVIIAEGIATAQSIHEVTKAVTVVAFSGGNLEDVAIAVRKLNAKAEIILAADGDPSGRDGSAAAIKAVGGIIIEAPEGKDFNDVPIELPEDPLWRADLVVKHYEDGSQKVLCRTHNIILILTHAKEFRGRIAFDEFAKEVTVDGQPLTDAMAIRMKAQLEKDWIPDKVSTAEVHEALAAVASDHSYHPVRDYLRSLHWDGVERVPTFFSEYFSAPGDAYHQQTAVALFVSSVSRVMKPGNQVDIMVVLEGAQGVKKTSFWKVLFGKWYASITTSVNDKDFFIGLRGVWGADFGELDQFSKAETTRIKLVITDADDSYRLPYARTSTSVPRQNVFIGSTNNAEYLRDPTGDRRFYPVKVFKKKIDIDAISAIRDQLWAEAVIRYERGEKWWDIEGAAEQQEMRFQVDVWEPLIYQYLLMRNETTQGEIMTDCLKIEVGRQGRAEQMRVANILTRLKFERKRESGGDRKYKYMRRTE